jgi:hypothetical protein
MNKQDSQAYLNRVAWVMIVGLTILSLFGAIARLGNILAIVFPVITVGMALFFYMRLPAMYVGFSWWLFCLAPFVRRLADFYGGYTEQSLILLAPFLVAAIPTLTMLRDLPKVKPQQSLPFVLATLGILYGFLIGLVNRSPALATKAFIEWIAPVAFGFHLLRDWKQFPSYQKVTQKTFLWIALLTGGYGIYQYLVAPGWDTFWMINANISSVGNPEPQGIRVWSTLNSPEPFAGVMAAALIIGLSYPSKLQLPAVLSGLFALLLTAVRASWLGWLVGFLSVIFSSKLKSNFNLLIMAGLLVPVLIVLGQQESFAGLLQQRFLTFLNPQDDGSFTGRSYEFQNRFDDALINVIGDGLGGSSYDNFVLAILMNTGWIGTILYSTGIALATRQVFQPVTKARDMFPTCLRGAVLTGLSRILVNSPTLGASGAVFWGCLGLGIAMVRYYRAKEAEEQLNQIDAAIDRPLLQPGSI